MENFKKKLNTFYDNYFPLVNDENIFRRSIILYAVIYIALFNTSLVLISPDVTNTMLLIICYSCLGLLLGSFILAKRKPLFKDLFSKLSAIKLFILFYILFLGMLIILTFLISGRILDFTYNNFLGFLYLIGFGVCPVILLFYYIFIGAKKITTVTKHKTENSKEQKDAKSIIADNKTNN